MSWSAHQISCNMPPRPALPLPRRVSEPVLMPPMPAFPSEPALLFCPGTVLAHFPRCCSQQGAGPVLPSVAVSEGWDQFSTVLRHQHGLWWQPRPGMSVWPLDSNIDPCYGKIMDPYMALRCSLGPDVTMALDGSTSHRSVWQPGISTASE